MNKAVVCHVISLSSNLSHASSLTERRAACVSVFLELSIESPRFTYCLLFQQHRRFNLVPSTTATTSSPRSSTATTGDKNKDLNIRNGGGDGVTAVIMFRLGDGSGFGSIGRAVASFRQRQGKGHSITTQTAIACHSTQTNRLSARGRFIQCLHRQESRGRERKRKMDQ